MNPNNTSGNLTSDADQSTPPHGHIYDPDSNLASGGGPHHPDSGSSYTAPGMTDMGNTDFGATTAANDNDGDDNGGNIPPAPAWMSDHKTQGTAGAGGQ